jgi:phenylpyruvate tautomerase PptA (4-oxalocrotonate tautomerase family)
MPTITVTAPKGALGKPGRDKLMKRLSDTLLKWEGADVGNAAAQAIAWTYYNEVPTGNFYVGGVNTDAPRFKIDVTTPEGALDDASRTQLVQEIGVVVDEATDRAGTGQNHWVLFNEIFEGGWGAAGRIFRRADIVATARGGPTQAA